MDIIFHDNDYRIMTASIVTVSNDMVTMMIDILYIVDSNDYGIISSRGLPLYI